MIIRNYTPHALHFYNNEEQRIATIDSIGVIRAKQEPYKIEDIVQFDTITKGIQDIPIMEPTSFGEPDFVPERQMHVIYVVSQIAASAIKKYHPERNDFYIVAETVRLETGEIIGCKSLTRL